MIHEEFHDGIRAALMGNFPSAGDAVLELIDNGVDDWEGEVQKRRVDIDIELDSLQKSLWIRTKGEVGMGYKEMENFLKWGHSQKVGRIGQWGQGGKAACGYLAEGLKLRCSKRGEATGWEVNDPSWGTRKERGAWEPRQFLCHSGDAFVEITLSGLKRKLSLEPLVARVSSVYRPLLKSGRLEVGVRDGKGGRKVDPLDIPLREKQKDFTLPLRSGTEVEGWIGIMTPKIRKGAEHLRGGIRCYHYGRLISDGEFFGHPEPSYRASLNSLIGELYLNLPIRPNLNKSNFDKDSDEWKQIEEKLHGLLEPVVRKLLHEREEEVPKKEIERARKALRLIQQAFKELEKSFKGMLGESEGEKPAVPKPPVMPPDEPPEPKPPRKERTDKGGTHEPATPPPDDAEGKRRRLGGVDFEIQAGDGTMRSRTGSAEKNGEKENGKIKVIAYSRFPAYEAFASNNRSHMLYLMETLALELAKPGKDEDGSVQPYLNRVNEALALACRNLLKERVVP